MAALDEGTKAAVPRNHLFSSAMPHQDTNINVDLIINAFNRFTSAQDEMNKLQSGIALKPLHLMTSIRVAPTDFINLLEHSELRQSSRDKFACLSIRYADILKCSPISSR